MPQVLNLDELHEMKRKSAIVECSCRDMYNSVSTNIFALYPRYKAQKNHMNTGLYASDSKKIRLLDSHGVANLCALIVWTEGSQKRYKAVR